MCADMRGVKKRIFCNQVHGETCEKAITNEFNTAFAFFYTATKASL